jgi:hypothetical protein
MLEKTSAAAFNPVFAGWDAVPNSGDVLAVDTMPDGTLLGIGMNNTIFTRTNLAYW